MTFNQGDSSMSATQIIKAMTEQTIAENKRDYDIGNSIQKQADAEYADAMNQRMTEMQEAAALQHNRSEFLSTVKHTLLSECIYKLYKESVRVPLTEQNKNISRNIINAFINENGVSTLLSSFRTKNLLLSEMNRIVNKHYERIVEECSNKECNFIVPDTIKNDFIEDLRDLDVDEASKLIKDRVADSLNEFIDSNTLAKLEYEELLNNTQNHIANMNPDTDAAKIESASHLVQREINEMEMKRSKNIFHYIVEKLSEASLKDEGLKKIYTEGATLNMDKIVDHAQLYLTMLEVANTTNMINIDEQYMNNYIESLGK